MPKHHLRIIEYYVHARLTSIFTCGELSSKYCHGIHNALGVYSLEFGKNSYTSVAMPNSQLLTISSHGISIVKNEKHARSVSINC